MKKKLFLFTCIMVILACAFAFSVSAAEPDATNETVTLADGTTCPLWDTDGNPLIWYVTGTTDGVKSYDYVVATSSEVDYNGGHSDKTAGVTWYQLSTVTINVDGASYGASSIAVFNIKSSEVKITSGKNIGQHVNCASKVFKDSTNIEYVYFPLDMIDINCENFKNCKALKFVNLAELTELREISSQDFNSGECKNLFAGQVLDLSNTKIVKLEQGALACVAATEIILPKTLVDVGQWSFQSCKFATKITFLGDITSMNTNAIFNGCNALEEVVGFKLSANATSIGGNAFKECYKIRNAGDLIVDGILTLPEGIQEIGTFAFTQCDEIEAIIFPSTITKVYQQGFSYMDKVKVVSFDAHNAKVASGEKTSGVEFNNCGHFRGLVSLTAFTMPLNTIEASNRMLADCTNLTAVYMPNSIKYLASNGGGQGPFCNSPKMYFVQDIFTVSQCLTEDGIDMSKLVLPQKPDVYFMPTSLEKAIGHIYSNDTWCNATLFKNCSSINSVLVFPESFTNITTMRAFEGMGTVDSPKTIVFLGDISEFSISHQSKYIGFVFANSADKTFTDLGIKRVTGNSNEAGSYAYFCSTGKMYNLAVSGRVGSDSNPDTEASIANIAATIAAILATETNESKHVTNPNREVGYVDADCLNNSAYVHYCFCGGISERVDEENTALGHEFSVENGATILSLIYNDYFKKGTRTTECSRCDTTESSDANAIIISFKGYSVKESGDGGLTFGYSVDENAIKEYERVNGISLEMGFVLAVKCFVVGNAPLNSDGTVAQTTQGSVMKISASSSETTYSGYDFKLCGAWDGQIEVDGAIISIRALELYIAGYVFDGSVSYIQNDEATDKEAFALTYNSIAGL